MRAELTFSESVDVADLTVDLPIPASCTKPALFIVIFFQKCPDGFGWKQMLPDAIQTRINPKPAARSPDTAGCTGPARCTVSLLMNSRALSDLRLPARHDHARAGFRAARLAGDNRLRVDIGLYSPH
jgi:hypothetical protein